MPNTGKTLQTRSERKMGLFGCFASASLADRKQFLWAEAGQGGSTILIAGEHCCCQTFPSITSKYPKSSFPARN
ncbi:MAG: hypothetical protein Kow0077_32230 [Anaerolineae bacterium]